ncbi:hypothetical protein AB205_0112050 [Aquarana catesbeiana]|uniref:Uncharacterized protein n=1 Tax=Aquarana catesbeiana TaxID=8400 RepID=A0A2G9Q638_AQUCT|nr:hypothetical protein AB205_0112050 [Aquarana catesbeiana]
MYLLSTTIVYSFAADLCAPDCIVSLQAIHPYMAMSGRGWNSSSRRCLVPSGFCHSLS